MKDNISWFTFSIEETEVFHVFQAIDTPDEREMIKIIPGSYCSMKLIRFDEKGLPVLKTESIVRKLKFGGEVSYSHVSKLHSPNIADELMQWGRMSRYSMADKSLIVDCVNSTIKELKVV
jgi:hypothetical protein